jgi:LmbE family N-acetylglucosaminyl deacetylase
VSGLDGDGWARRLASGVPIAEPVALVVAHPDDETLWAGAALGRLHAATLVLVTDGAPRDMGDAARLGFATREDYAIARAAELDAAVVALGGAPRLVRLEVADQDAAFRVAEIADRLVRECADVSAFLTHPYEGGHPDHDATALAVRLAADTLGVPVVEFACYAQFDGTRIFARFVADARCPEHRRPLDDADRAQVERALRAHASQASVFGTWRPDVERWRAAPRHDFTRPPPGEAVLYDSFGWTMTGERWRAATGAVAAPTT